MGNNMIGLIWPLFVMAVMLYSIAMRYDRRE